jgi:adenylate cyclase
MPALDNNSALQTNGQGYTMGIEIERKFLVQGTDWKNDAGVRYSQGYLNRDKARTVRVRVAGEQAFLTIKGISTGATRAEFEYPIPLADAQALLALCDGPCIEKTRYRLPVDGMVWEVDEFAGDNAGLVVAEIELQSEDQVFSRPHWLGPEVTHDARYFNSNLAAHPFSQWGDAAQ